MAPLHDQSCAPCHGGLPPLEPAARQAFLERLEPGWTLVDEACAIARTFRFGGYLEALAFVNGVAWMAHRADHHPDLVLGFDSVDVRYTTHAAGGLTENDFICAAKVERLFVGR
jgi:4a-hydroxytetrahydrobiopterin dehydratase